MKMSRPVPVYIPTKKITIFSPPELKKLAFLFNYKTLKTRKMSIDSDIVEIILDDFEEFRKCLRRWQRKQTPSETQLWRFFQENIIVEISLTDVEENDSHYKKDQPYVPKIRFDKDLIEQFTSLFQKSEIR